MVPTSPGEGVQLGTSTTAWARGVQNASFHAATTRCRASVAPGSGIIFGERVCPALLCYRRGRPGGGERSSRALGSARETCVSSTSSIRMESPTYGKKYGCAKEVELPLSLVDQEEGWRDREEYAVQRYPGLLDTPKPEVPLLSRWPLVPESLLERQPQFVGLIYCMHWCAECGDRLCARVCIPWVEPHFPHLCSRCYVRSESTMESSLDTTETEPYPVSRAGEGRGRGKWRQVSSLHKDAAVVRLFRPRKGRVVPLLGKT